MRQATSEEIGRWDELIEANPDHGEILQTKTWGEFKGRWGWKPRYVVFDIAGTKLYALFCVRHSLLGEVWYSPKGPGVWTAEQLIEVAEQIKQAHPAAFVVKLEPELWEDRDVKPKQLAAAGLSKAPFDVHLSRATIRVNLKPSEDDMLAGFKQKTRYNIRYAIKNNVVAEAVEGSPDNLETMYELMQQTGQRAGFFLRPREYFLGYWQEQIRGGQGQLFFARHEGEVVAAAFITHLGTKAWYKDGASNRTKSNLMAPYLLQWQIIIWLKANGFTKYDLVGIPPLNQIDKSHPFHGLYLFKSGFGGEEIQFIGTYDLPLQGWRYRLWRLLGERLTLAYYARVKKELWY